MGAHTKKGKFNLSLTLETFKTLFQKSKLLELLKTFW